MSATLVAGRRHLAERRFDAALACAQALVAEQASSCEGYELRAEALLKVGRLAEALTDLDRAAALAKGEDLVRVLDGRGELQRRLGKLVACEADASRRLALSPRHAGGYLSRAEARRGLGRFAAALSDLRRAQRFAPRDPWVWVVRAKTLRALGRNDKALECCEQAVKLAPRHAKALAWRGETLRAAGRLEEAVASLDAALQADPHCAWALALKGQTRVELGQVQAGESEIEAAFELDPRCSGGYDFLAGGKGLAADPLFAWAHAWRGAAAAAQGDAEEAERFFTRALALAPQWAWLWRRRGQARLAAERPAKALSDFDRAAALSPRSGAARFWRGEARRLAGDAQGALPDLNAAVWFEPRLAPAYGSRALAKLALGSSAYVDDLRAAASLDGRWNRALQQASVSAASELRDERYWLAWAQKQFELGRGPQAREMLERAAARDPHSAALRWLCWRALGEGGRGASGGRDELEAAAALGLEEPQVYARLAAARLKDGDPVGCVKALEKAARLDPDHRWAYAAPPRQEQGAVAAADRSRLRAELARLKRARGLDKMGKLRLKALRADLLRLFGRFEEAYCEIEGAKGLFEGCQWYWECSLGELALKAGRAAVARRRLDRAVAAAPGRALPLCWRGELYFWLGKPKRALADLTNAVEAEPAQGWARAWRGQVLLWLGRYAEAGRDLDEALRLDPAQGWAHGWRGAALLLSGKPREALTRLDRALELDATDVEARVFRGEALRALRRREEALQEFDRAVTLDPGRVWARLSRAGLRLRMGDEDGARRDLDVARAEAPELLRGRSLEEAFAVAKGNRTHRRLK